jgi:uncharacterized protein
MRDRRLYDIGIISLSHKEHIFNYELSDSFFELFEDSFIKKGALKVTLKLNKSETFIQANFILEGTVELVCDRSLENFDYPVSTNDTLLVKFGESFEELSESIIVIPRDQATLNIAQYLFEYIGLAIPMKKLHPRFSEENESEDSENVLIYSTIKPEDLNNDEEDKVDEAGLDPRWDLLKNIRNNFN